MRGLITIIQITKQECFELNKQGFNFGSGGILHKSKNKHHPKYYMTESRKALETLIDLRKKQGLL